MAKAKVEFAPDGKHFVKIAEGSIGKMWDYFNFNPEILIAIWLNPYAKFRLIGETGKVIGERGGGRCQ